ncbi:hypothetical protein KQI77_00960 [Clostridium sp. MSJ-8]|uniref:hypothetical protein n=1 Tax=Clostridium sp. MSJ-8 TaxID=2841510 RepID=UPI001C0F1BE1|nr:hypothetical protein [Clostridium sp. MSJ-8]MBU5486738.1 hypothetical protein [Clostridium sp. MSJ-8]
MKGTKILERKLDKLNTLKGRLIDNSFRNNNEKVIEDIKETVEDLEAILLDMEYIKEDNEDTSADSYRTYRSFRDYDTFTAEEVQKYNGVDGTPLYIDIEGKVYDVSNKLPDSVEDTIDNIKSYYEDNRELLEDCTQVGVLEE